MRRIKRDLGPSALDWLLTLIVLSILAVLLGISLSHGDKQAQWARVWGGPTEGPAPVTLRIEIVDNDPSHARQPGPVTVRLTDREGRLQERHSTFGDDGSAFVTFSPTGTKPIVDVLTANGPLASGPIELSRTEYWRRQRGRGGWFNARSEGAVRLRAGCRDGVFVMGQAGRLGISVTDSVGRGIRRRLSLSLEGLEPLATSSLLEISSDERGYVTLAVVPRDLAASIRISVAQGETQVASYFASIPIEMSGLSAKLRDATVVIESLVPIQRSYFTLLNEQGRWAAGSIRLVCGPDGHCSGRGSLEAPPPSPAWLAVGTEPALDGPNVIGWPVSAPEEEFVSRAVTIPDSLLLDGKAAALVRVERARARRLELTLAGSALAFLVLGTSIVRSWLRSRSDLRRLAEQLPENANSLTQGRSISLLILAVLLMLALAAVTVWASLRI